MRSVRSLSGFRAKRKKDQKKRLILYCEDMNASPDYFMTLNKKHNHVILEIIRAAGEPKSIASSAIKKMAELEHRLKRDKSVEDDEVWAVFDRDEHIWFDEAFQNCIQKSVGVAYANPCFELWILLHQNTCHNSADDRHQIQTKCSKFLPGYDKKGAKTGNFTGLVDLIEVAEKNAKWLAKEREKEGNPNGRPSTNIYKLTELICGKADAS